MKLTGQPESSLKRNMKTDRLIKMGFLPSPPPLFIPLIREVGWWIYCFANFKDQFGI